MNYNFRATASLIKLPDGLNELLSDMCREVLRYQPDEICEFLANYLDALLVAREKLQASAVNRQRVLAQYQHRVRHTLKKYNYDTACIDRIERCIEAEIKSGYQRHQRNTTNDNVLHLNIDRLAVAIQRDSSHLNELPTHFDHIHGVLTDSLNYVDQKEMVRKIIDYDYRWINDTVERTFDCYRKRQRIINANRLTAAAVRIQRAYRKYRLAAGAQPPCRIREKNADNRNASYNRTNMDDLNQAASIIQLAFLQHKKRSKEQCTVVAAHHPAD